MSAKYFAALVLICTAACQHADDFAPTLAFSTVVVEEAFEVTVINKSKRPICIPTDLSPNSSGRTGYLASIAFVNSDPMNDYLGTFPVENQSGEPLALAPGDAITVTFDWADFERPSEINAESEFSLTTASYCADE